MRFAQWSADRRYIILGLAILSILQLKSLLVRSDIGHVALAATPLLFLFLLLTYETISQKQISLIGLIITFIFASTLSNGNWFRTVADMLARPSGVVEKLSSAFQYEMPTTNLVPDGLAQSLDPDSILLNFPHENVMSVALRRSNISPILQPYAAQNTVLQEWYVAEVAKAQDRVEIIYCAEHPGIDGVDHITRSPIIFEHFLRYFELKNDQLYGNRCVILQPRQQPYQPPSTPVAFSQTSEGTVDRVTFNDMHSCNLLRLQMSVHYPFTRILGRTTPVSVRVMVGPTVMTEQRVVPIETRTVFTTYLNLSDPNRSFDLFGNPSRINDNTPVDMLEFTPVAFGPFDVQYQSIRLHNVQCVDFVPGSIVPSQIENNITFGELTAGRLLRQEFVADRDELSGVYLKMATYNRTNTTPVTFSLYRLEQDGQQTPVATSTVDSATLRDNQFFLFSFERQRSLGQRYIVTVESQQATTGNAVTAWLKSDNPYTSGQLWDGNQERQDDLTFKLIYAGS
jgi:hypothetical protein